MKFVQLILERLLQLLLYQIQILRLDPLCTIDIGTQAPLKALTQRSPRGPFQGRGGKGGREGRDEKGMNSWLRPCPCGLLYNYVKDSALSRFVWLKSVFWLVFWGSGSSTAEMFSSVRDITTAVCSIEPVLHSFRKNVGLSNVRLFQFLLLENWFLSSQISKNVLMTSSCN